MWRSYLGLPAALPSSPGRIWGCQEGVKSKNNGALKNKSQKCLVSCCVINQGSVALPRCPWGRVRCWVPGEHWSSVQGRWVFGCSSLEEQLLLLSGKWERFFTTSGPELLLWKKKWHKRVLSPDFLVFPMRVGLVCIVWLMMKLLFNIFSFRVTRLWRATWRA